MTANVIQGSFAAGELSPSLTARVDLAKYRTGAAMLRNFFVDYRGGASNRPGTRFLARCPKDSELNVRLIPFQYSTLQAYILEFGDHYMRVYKDGGLVTFPPLSISDVSQGLPATVSQSGHGYSTGDYVFIDGVVGMTQINGRTYLINVVNANTYTLKDFNGVDINSFSYGGYVSGGTAAKVFTLATPYSSSDIPDLKRTQSADVMTLTHPDHPPYDLTRTDHNAWTISEVDFAPNVLPPSGVAGGTTAAGTVRYSYCVTAVDADGNESVASAIVTVASVDLGNAATPPTITITWNPVTDAAFYRVYKTFRTTTAAAAGTTGAQAASQYGLVGATAGLSFEDANVAPDYITRPPNHADPFGPSPIAAITVSAGGAGITTSDTIGVVDATGSGAVLQPIIVGGVLKAVVVLSGGRDYVAPVVTMTSAGTPPTLAATLGPASGMNPSVVAYFEQRKVYAATRNEPQRFWMSQPGLYTNFDLSNPIQDDDSISGVLASTQVNAIKSMLSMPSGLIMLTSGGAWQVSGGAQGTALSPTSVTAKAQSYNGVSNLEPIVINFDILYVQALGSVVRDLSYNFFANVYTGTDITVLSNHLFYGYTLLQWAWAEEPYKIVWAPRSDGRLLSLTFLKEQDVYGWALHETRGLFQDVASIPEGTEQSVYFVVKRFINEEWVQYVEQLHSRQFASVEDAWFVDCGAELAPATTADYLQALEASGTGVVFGRSSPLFVPGDVGKVIRVGGGVAEIKTYVDPRTVLADITVDITEVLPVAGTPLLAAPGEWSIAQLVTSITGLDHLEGQTVAILGDGNVYPNQVVSAGRVTLNHPASRIIIGLPYQAQFQSLRLDTGEPTIQGKRKKISAVTMRVDKSRGLAVGTTFDTAAEIKERVSQPYGHPIAVITGDERITMDPSWNEEGQVCAIQVYPLPATILGIIPEIVIGDT